MLRRFAANLKVEANRLVIRYALPETETQEATFGFANIVITAVSHEDHTASGAYCRWQTTPLGILAQNEKSCELDEKNIVRAPAKEDDRFFGAMLHCSSLLAGVLKLL